MKLSTIPNQEKPLSSKIHRRISLKKNSSFSHELQRTVFNTRSKQAYAIDLTSPSSSLEEMVPREAASALWVCSHPQKDFELLLLIHSIPDLS